MSDQPEKGPLDSEVNCPCGQKAHVASVYVHGDAKVFIFLCNTCERLVVMGAAPDLIGGGAKVNGHTNPVPILILAQKAQKILLPQTQLDVSHLRKI